MVAFTIAASTGSYEVVVESGSAETVAADRWIIDDQVRVLYPQLGDAAAVPFHASEEHKTLAGCEEVLAGLHQSGLRRGMTVAAAGGGSVQDIGTFATSVYMRGVPWIFLPTTALSMADSCIGGKSSLNLRGVKNLVGNIYPPQRVVVDPVFLGTLDDVARACGLAEAVKICFASGQESFEEFVGFDRTAATLGADPASVALIAHTLRAKKCFIEADEFDGGVRLHLNFGHSFGHALEAATGYAMPHGLAVAFGMVAACLHPGAAHTPGTQSLIDYVRGLVRPLGTDVLERMLSWDRVQFVQALASDKKNSASALRLILPAVGGGVSLVDFPMEAKQLDTCRDAMAAAMVTVMP